MERSAFPGVIATSPRSATDSLPKTCASCTGLYGRSAIEAAKGSGFLKDALGADMHRTFTAIKAAEYARVARTIADVDYDLYLHTV